MSISAIMDKTDAIRRRPSVETASGIDRTTGRFVDPVNTDLAIKIHVSKPKADEVLAGGLHVEQGDDIIHLERTLDVVVGDVLIYWGKEHQVVAETRPQYDTLAAVVGHDRKRLLVRFLKPGT